MILVALTGGIGSGKSSVSERLAAKGATVVDADAITRDLQQPGTEVVAAMAEAFGADVLLPDGNLDRPAVAARVFGDPEALKRLNRIVHPAVNDEMRRQSIEAGERGELVIQDIPLLAESPAKRPQYSGVVVVDVDPELAVERLVRHRGMSEEDARARMARQADRQLRLGLAGFVVDNSGTVADLDTTVAEAWAWITSCPDVPLPTKDRDRTLLPPG